MKVRIPLYNYSSSCNLSIFFFTEYTVLPLYELPLIRVVCWSFEVFPSPSQSVLIVSYAKHHIPFSTVILCQGPKYHLKITIRFGNEVVTNVPRLAFGPLYWPTLPISLFVIYIQCNPSESWYIWMFSGGPMRLDLCDESIIVQACIRLAFQVNGVYRKQSFFDWQSVDKWS